MGENIYTICGYSSPIANFVADVKAQENAFKKFIVARGINFTAEEILTDILKRNLFSRRYNGSTAYGAKLVEAAE